MKPFAKLYENTKYGQILVMLQEDVEDNKPEIRFFCQPPELGICSTAYGYEDWETAESLFENEVTQETAEHMVAHLIHLLAQ